MARPKKEVEAKKKPVVVEGKTLEKPSPKPSPAPQKPLSSARLANPFDLLDEDSSDLISIVDAKKDDAFVAAERKRREEEKKVEREAKIKAREEEKKAAREAKKKAIQEKKAHDASILRFHSSRPNPSFSRGPKPALANDGVQSQLTKNSSGVELQAKESQGDAAEKAVAEIALAKEVVSFSLVDADFPVLGNLVHAIRSPAGESVGGKVAVGKAPKGNSVAKKSGAKKA